MFCSVLRHTPYQPYQSSGGSVLLLLFLSEKIYALPIANYVKSTLLKTKFKYYHILVPLIKWKWVDGNFYYHYFIRETTSDSSQRRRDDVACILGELSAIIP